MDRKALLEKELDTFVEKVKTACHPNKIILFGSFASVECSDNSDLDLVVVAPSNEDFWGRLKNISQYCSRRVGMDVLFYTPEEFNKLIASRNFFKKEIQGKGKLLYEQN